MAQRSGGGVICAASVARTESVAWISERKDVLCAFFFLLTIWSYAAWTAVRGAMCFVMSGTLALFALALMSKPMAVTLPFVLLLSGFLAVGAGAGESESGE